MSATTVAAPPRVSLTTGRLPRWAPWALLGFALFVAAALFAVMNGGGDIAQFNIAGTLVVTMVLYLLAIAVVSSIAETRRHAVDRVMTGLVATAFLIALLPLISLLYTVAVNGIQRFFYITLPQLKDTTLILLVLRTVWTATYYDLIQMITGGGPAGATTHLPIMIYQNSFGNPNIAYASAVAVFLGVLMFVFVVIYAKKSGAAED